MQSWRSTAQRRKAARAFRAWRGLTRRSRGGRKYRNPTKQVIKSSIPGSLGTSMLQKFRYVDKITLNPVAGGSATYSYRANSLYDPDFTGTGHQPIGFDQLMNFYNHYTVLGSRLKVTFVATGSNPLTGAAIVGIELSGSSPATTAINDLYEQGRSRMKIMTNANADQKVVVNHNLSVKKFLGQNPLDEDANAGTAAANPTEVIFFHVFATGIDTTTDPGQIDVIVELEQVAMLHEAKPLAGS